MKIIENESSGSWFNVLSYLLVKAANFIQFKSSAALFLFDSDRSATKCQTGSLTRLLGRRSHSLSQHTQFLKNNSKIDFKVGFRGGPH